MKSKILFPVVTKLGSNSSVTGPERRLLQMLPHFVKNEIEPLVLYPRSGVSYEKFKSLPGVNCLDNIRSSVYSFGTFLYYCRLLMKYRPDCVHSQGAAANDLIWAVICKIFKVRFVITRPVLIEDQVHYSGWKKAFYSLIDRNLTLKLCDQLITVSKFGYEHYSSLTPILEKKTVLIFNGIERPATRLPKQSDGLNIAMTAHLSKFKGWYDFIDVVGLVRRKNIKIVAHIIGDGELYDQLREAVISKGLSTVVQFHGSVDNVLERLSFMDMFLFTSHREGLSVAVIEALASGLPVVMSNVSGSESQVIEGKNGYVCDVGNVDCMADRVAKIASDVDLRLNMGNESLSLFEKLFDFDKMVRGYLKCYHI